MAVAAVDEEGGGIGERDGIEGGAGGGDDSLKTYLPGIPNGNDITIRQVPGMSAGIRDVIYAPRVTGD